MVGLVIAGIVRESGGTGSPSSRPGPWFGVLRVSTRAQAERLAGTGLDRAVVSLDWNRYEPAPGRTDPGYVAGIATLVAQLRSQGVGVVLDPGLQHPPPWVFGLPGGTRFRDQYGVVWNGSAADGTAVADAVFDPHVRAAEAGYLRRVAADLGGGSFAGIRVGGLLSGELRYPPADDGAGHHDALWYFDASARVSAPVPGWRPGGGSRADTARSVDAYLGALTGYERWLLRATAGAFPNGRLDVLLPGWGLRPGQVGQAVADGLDGRSRAEQGGMLASGLDWAQQVPALEVARSRAVAYTTWLDAASGGSTPQLVSPVQYLASLAAPEKLPVAGENTRLKGTGTQARTALRICLSRVRALRLAGMMWMDEPDLLAARGGLTLAQYAGAVSAYHSPVRVND
ncbi:hypothetical protein [Streptantibioticus silvisoli]|uniref:Glycoside hydrolase family 42 N-terminal domain-containing protein n=1 Tax=Streptantibioticus silvisoli TaxID=2705255 RepID=A0ABT6WB80_9ACTN|nr:hypothetical protein [Streptantibioticus silvisoli]MDI5967730.1 hypothetical protein [Streptantibioticus silvisoli]